MLEPENVMKFDQIHPRPDTDPNPYNFAGADALVAFAKTHNMKMRGHTLVWHSQQPAWVTRGHLTSSELATTLHNHIKTVMSRYKGKIYAWDVVNEAFNDDGSLRNTVWYDRPGIGLETGGTSYIEQSLKWAREADPKSKLIYNDYSAEVINKKSDAIYAMAKDFKKRRVPLDGIGLQMHCDLSFGKPEVLQSFRENIKRFAKLGLDVHITELDVRLHDNKPDTLQAQADLYHKIVQICLDEPKCRVIQIWGFTDKHSWIPGFYRGQGWALLWDEQYARKAACDRFLEALLSPRMRK